MEKSNNNKQSLKAAGKKRLEEFRLKRQQKVEGSPASKNTDLPDENESLQQAGESSKEVENQENISAENVSGAGEIENPRENDALQQDDEGFSSRDERIREMERRLCSSGLDLEQKVATIEALNSSLQRCREECENAELERENAVVELGHLQRRKDEELEQLEKTVRDLKAGEKLAGEENAGLRSKLQEALTQLELEKQKISDRDEENERSKAELARSIAELESDLKSKDEELEELRRSELSRCSLTIEELEKRDSGRASENEALREAQKVELEGASRSISELESKINLLKDERLEHLQKLEEMERLMAEVLSRASAYEKRDSQLELEVMSLRSELASLEEKSREALAEAEQGKLEVLRRDAEVSWLNSELSARALELEQAERKSVEELEALRSELEQKSVEELEALRSELEKTSGDVSELENEKARLKTELEIAAGDVFRGGSERLEFERKLQEVALEARKQARIDSLEGFVRMLAKLSASAELLAEEEDTMKLQASLEALENEASKMNFHSASLEKELISRVSELQKSLAEGDLERNSAAATIAQQDAAIRNLQNEVLQANSRRDELALKVERFQQLENQRGARLESLELKLGEAGVALDEANECMQKIRGIVDGVCEAPGGDSAGKVEHLAREFLALLEKSSISEKAAEEKLVAEKQAKDRAITELESLSFELSEHRKNDAGFKAGIEAVASTLLELLPVEMVKKFSDEPEALRRIGLIAKAIAQQTGSIKAQLVSFEEEQLQLRDEEARRVEGLESGLNNIRDELARKVSELEIVQKNDAGLKAGIEAATSSFVELLPVEMVNEFSEEPEVVRRFGLIVEVIAGCYRESVQQASLMKAQLFSVEEARLQLRNEESRRVEGLESGLNLLRGELSRKTSELEVVQGNWETELQKVAKLETQLASATVGGDACKKELEAVSSHRDRLQQELLDSEQRLSGVREKLGMAIKKGKGLAQQRDELRQELAQKASELEELKTASSRASAELESGFREKHELRQELAQKASELEELSKASSRASAELESGLREKQEELEKLKLREHSLAVELGVLKRKLGEVVEEKQLLDESKREAWKQVQLVVNELEFARAEVREKNEVEARLRSCIAASEQESKKLERELLLVIESLEAELSRGYEEKMAALAEVDKLAKKLLRLVCSRDQLEAEQKPSPWMFLKAMASSPRKTLQAIKERGNVEASQILESSSSTRGILEEMIAALQQQGGLQGLVSRLETNDRELITCKEDLAAKQRGLESLLHEAEEKERLGFRVEELEELLEKNDSAMGNLEFSRNKAVGKLTFTLGKLTELQQQCEAMLAEIESLQTNLESRQAEITGLNNKVETLQRALDEKSESFLQLETRLRGLIDNGAGAEPIEALEAELQRLKLHNEKLESGAQRKDAELKNLRAQVEKLTAGKLRVESEIVEVEQQEQKHIAVASAPHFRSLKKTPLPAGDHHQVVIDMEDQSLSVEEKGNAFKSLGMLRYFPKAAHRVGDHIDTLSLSAGHVLMRQPLARLSLILYWIAIHVWILATVSVAKL